MTNLNYRTNNLVYDSLMSLTAIFHQLLYLTSQQRVTDAMGFIHIYTILYVLLAICFVKTEHGLNTRQDFNIATFCSVCDLNQNIPKTA